VSDFSQELGNDVRYDLLEIIFCNNVNCLNCNKFLLQISTLKRNHTLSIILMGDSKAIRIKFSLALLTLSILTIAILPGVANAMSPNTFCGDKAGLETISTGEFVNIIVPSPGAGVDGKCKLTGTVDVTGNVKVQPGGELEVTDGVEIDGNLQANGAAKIYVGTVVGPIIDGNVQIKGSTGVVIIDGSSIGGDIKIKDQSAGTITIDDNEVSGSIKLRGNTAEVIDVINNDVDGDIKLEDNEGTSSSDRNPINVEDNDVVGNIELHNNLVSGSGGRDIEVEDNIIGGNLVVEDNESLNDDIEIEDNDVGGDLTVNNNIADENGSTGSDVDVEDNCMTGNGNIEVKNNVAAGRIEVNGNGDPLSGVASCSSGEPTNVTVEGNTAENGEFDLRNNFVLGDYTIEGNTLAGNDDFEINDNDVTGDLIVIDNTITGAGDIEVKGNTGGDELLCSGNDPDPTTSGNTGFTTTDCSD